MSSIHSSKRQKIFQPSPDKTDVVVSGESIHETDDDIDNADDDDFIPEVEVKRKIYHKTRCATNLVTKYSLSTRQASRVCSSLADNAAAQSAQLPMPSQSGVWKGVINEGRKKIALIKAILQRKKDFYLHFDGKKLSRKEYQVVCLQSLSRKLNLEVLVCKDGSAEKIFSELEKLLDYFDTW